MKFIATIFAVLILSTAQSQTITSVGTGEYAISYLLSDGTLKTVTGSDGGYSLQTIPISGVVDQVEAGQYNTLAKKSNGRVYSIIGGTTTDTASYPLDNLGQPFAADYMQGIYKNVLALQNGELYYWMINHAGDRHNPREDILNQGYNGIAPKKLIQPAGGKTLTKIASASATAYGDLTYAWTLASDGTLWQWDRTHTTPFQVTGGWSGTIVDIGIVGPNAFVVVTSTNQIWAWGYLANYIGAQPSWQNPNPQNITTLWTNAGLTFPIKQIATTYNTLHFIDANDNMFGAGCNVQGNVGNGLQWPSWRTYTPLPYQWSLVNEQVIQAPVQILGKYKNIQSNNTVAFYLYAQDLGNNWYSWGRNKARVLGNGLSMTSVDEAVYSEYYNIPAARLVTPLTQTWTVAPTVNPNANRSPVASAGINQYISGTSTTLYGEYSHQQQPTAGSTTVTMTNAWTKISGATCTIVSPTSQNTSLTGLTAGTYVFRNTVTNSNGATDFQEVRVVVSGTPPPSTTTDKIISHTRYVN